MKGELLKYSERESNPHGHYWPQDFKSGVSTYSTIRALFCGANVLLKIQNAKFKMQNYKKSTALLALCFAIGAMARFSCFENLATNTKNKEDAKCDNDNQ